MLEKLPEHPNICKYYETFCDEKENIIYLVMELIEEGSLQTWLNNNEASSRNEDQIVGYFMQMVVVVLFLFENKIVHRDLKPDNFLKQGDNILLIDFGLSKESQQSII